MNWDAIGAAAELLGALGVIVSLLYLATQIRQNTKSVRATAADSAADRFTEDLRAIASNPELAELMEEGHRDYASLEGARRRRYRDLVLVHFREYETIFLKYCDGLIRQDQWEGYANSLYYANRRPGIRQCWREIGPNFSSGFRALVDENVEKVAREKGDVPETSEEST